MNTLRLLTGSGWGFTCAAVFFGIAIWLSSKGDEAGEHYFLLCANMWFLYGMLLLRLRGRD